jgi:predicted TIM-barrel fold metal-dependent hydrolase
MLFDTHAHFYTNDLQRYPVHTANAREGEEKLKQRIQADAFPSERVLALWDDNRVAGGAGVQYNTVYKTDNRYLLDVSAQHPKRIAPVVMLDATAAETPETLGKYITDRGVVGLRLYGRAEPDGSYPWLDSPAALRTWEVANRHALAMVLMCAPARVAPSALRAIAALARRFPATTIALDHFGWAGFAPAQFGLPEPLVHMREHRNVYYKLTTINFHMLERAGLDSAQFVRRAVDVFGADRMMWGSDMGNTRESYRFMAHRARASAVLLTPSERKQVLCDTGTKLFARR